MSQVVASYRSIEANVMSFQASSQRQSVSVQGSGVKKHSHILNTQEQQIVDEVGISDAAVKQFEESQLLAQKLQEYLDYLKGRESRDLPRIKSLDDEASISISGRSTNLAASVTVGSIKEETLEIVADFDDDGALSALTVTQTQTTVEFIHAEIILEDRQFYAAIS